MNILSENISAKDGFQQVYTFLHRKGSFALVIDSKENAGAEELEGLDERPVGFVVIDGVHLRHEDIRVFSNILFEILIAAIEKVLVFCPLFILFYLYALSAFSGQYWYLLNRQWLQLEHPLQAPGVRSRLEQRKGT